MLGVVGSRQACCCAIGLVVELVHPQGANTPRIASQIDPAQKAATEADDNLAEVLYAASATTSIEPEPAPSEVPGLGGGFEVPGLGPDTSGYAEVREASPDGRRERESSPKPQPTAEELALSTTIPAPHSKQRTKYFIIKSYSAEACW